MRRRDLIPLLLDQPRTVSQLAREVRTTPRELADDLAHLLRSLPHTEFAAEITPARCRQCGFTFGPDKLFKPAKCPACRGTWIAEPRLVLRPRAPATDPAAATPDAAAPDAAPDGPDWLTLLDHTADTGLIVTAPDLPTLFSRAAWGLFSIIGDPASVQPAEAETVALDADDLPALLVRWLSELNFRHLTRHRLYAKFEVRELTTPAGPAPPPAPPLDAAAPEAAPCRLRAEIFGEPIVPGRHTLFTEVKAVTFHGLELTEVDGGWRAQIILDL